MEQDAKRRETTHDNQVNFSAAVLLLCAFAVCCPKFDGSSDVASSDRVIKCTTAVVVDLLQYKRTQICVSC